MFLYSRLQNTRENNISQKENSYFAHWATELIYIVFKDLFSLLNYQLWNTKHS